MPTSRKILFSIDAGVATVTLNRPDKRNALDEEMIAALKQSLQEAAGQGARVILLRGAGKDFCSGADLAALQRISAATIEDNVADARSMAELFILMRRHPLPIVAAVHGRALAGGCGLATAADLVLAAESAMFGYTEINVGFIPAIVMAILRRSVSEKRAFELISTGETMSARQFMEFGLVNRVFADARFEEDSAAFAARLAAKSSTALALCKDLFYHIDGLTFDAAAEAGARMNAISRMTEDCKQGVSRFLDKKG